MNPIIVKAALALGIQIVDRIVFFIADQVSQEEQKKSDELKKKYQEKCREAEEKRKKIISELEQNYSDELEKAYEKECAEIRAASGEDMIRELSDAAKERLDYVENILLRDINNALKDLKNHQKEYNSALRSNSFRLLKAELNEAKQKAHAYKSYLKRYISNLRDIYDSCTNEDELTFSFTLPKEYPYNEKLIFLSQEDFDHNKCGGELLFHKCMKVSFVIDDYDFYKSEPLSRFAVMNMGYDEENKRYIFSIQHGRYKQAYAGGCISGITAKVNGYRSDKKTIELLFGKDMELELEAKNLRNFNRYPFIGSEITVYPIDEFYSKEQKKMIYKVSERPEDADISLDFKEIPLVLSREKTMEFIEYYEENDLPLDCGDVKLAPMSASMDDILSPKYFKIQFGGFFTMVVEIKSDGERNYLWYDHFTNEARFSAEDIFIPFSADINVFNENDLEQFKSSNSNSCAFDNMNYLILTAFREFDLQYKLKNSYNGMRYFDAWENITAALKKYSEKGDHFVCHIDGIPKREKKESKGWIIKCRISNSDMLKRFYEKQLFEQEKSRFSAEFFIEHNNCYYTAEISADCENVNIIVPGNDDELVSEIMPVLDMTIYRRNYGIPEQRQLHAIHDFKVGSICNSVMQLYLLNGNFILPCRHENTDITLYNEDLKNNRSQYMSLVSSLNEENMFFIQGPPGTGKTTVIRELIAQTISRDSDARILIVSQANVAVDNVIKGLIDKNMPFDYNDIIRCGRSGKISSDIASLSYEKKYTDYIDSVRELSENADDKHVRKFAKQWLEIITEEKHGYDPDVGELIIRNHRIIGATCVGLSQKRIGIDKLIFDLVIIDEAGKALAPEIMIPLIRARKAVIIGDHKQLPAVIDPALYDEEKIELDERQYCKEEIFDKSFFERLFEKCPDSNKSVLDTQYRMPAVIGTMISELFYDAELKNGAGTGKKLPLYGKTNLSIIDMSGEKRYRENDVSSPVNEYEALYVFYLLSDIKKKCPDAKIAVITPYKGQKAYIRRTLINRNFDYSKNNIFIDTVDSFQGDEADIVIYCTTRAKKCTKFLSDKRRLNVAVSRARNEFIMIASVNYLRKYQNNTPIRRVFEYMSEYGSIIEPQRINDDKIVMNREPIRVSDIIFGDVCDADHTAYEGMIKKEIDYFNSNGVFSCYPKVYECDGMYILKDHPEIYFAAESLCIAEIFVEFADKENNVIIQMKENEYV